MCKILTIINTKESNNETLNAIINANIDTLKMERQGFSIFRDNKTTFHLQEDYEKFGELAKYNGEKVYCIHSRTSTGGSSDKKGLHLHKIGSWVWAHNGTVTKFFSVKDFSDSWYFFMSLLSLVPIDKPNHPLEKSLVEDAIGDLGFNGKGFLYNCKTEVLQWFCNQPSYVYALDGCLIISSYDITLETETYETKKVLGFEWVSNTFKTTIPVLHKEKIDDTILTFWKNNLIGRIPLIRKYYSTYNSSNSSIVTRTPINEDIPHQLTKREKKQKKFWENELRKEKEINRGGSFIHDVV